MAYVVVSRVVPEASGWTGTKMLRACGPHRAIRLLTASATLSIRCDIRCVSCPDARRIGLELVFLELGALPADARSHAAGRSPGRSPEEVD